MKNKLSWVALLVCMSTMLYSGFVFYPKWEKSGGEATLSWDVSGYYMYLPALFIYKELKQVNFLDSVRAKYQFTPNSQQVFQHSSGNKVMKYPIGQALVMLPAFGIAHAISSNSDAVPADGFSLPYQRAIGIWLFCWALLGLILFRRVLLFYFEDKVVAVALLLLVLATNYLDFSSIDQGMSHSTLFTLYSFLIWLTHHYYQRGKIIYLISASLVCGLMTLIRPTEIISLLIPLGWGVSSWPSFVDRIRQHASQWKRLLIGSVLFIAVVGIQVLYWKWVSGDWIVYSYEDQGFSFLHPHIKDYMFGFRAGWITYCPTMLLAFLGLPFFLKVKPVNWVVPIFFLLNLYIVSAWDIWWYGGRAMIQSYPILFFCVAALIQWSMKSSWSKYMLWLVLIGGIYFNVWWTFQCHAGQVRVFDTNYSYYFATLGKWKSTEEDLKLLDNKDRFRHKIKKQTTLYSFTRFQNLDSVSNKIDSLNYLISEAIADDTKQISMAWNHDDIHWIRVSGQFLSSQKEWEEWKMMQFIALFTHKSQKVKSTFIRIHRFLEPEQPRRIYFDVNVPSLPIDTLKLIFWNPASQTTTQISDLKVESIE